MLVPSHEWSGVEFCMQGNTVSMSWVVEVSTGVGCCLSASHTFVVALAAGWLLSVDTITMAWALLTFVSMQHPAQGMCCIVKLCAQAAVAQEMNSGLQ